MERAPVTSNEREQQRVIVLNRVERGCLTGEEAARLLGLSLREVRRLLARYRKEGIAVLAHMAIEAADTRTLELGVRPI